MRRLAVPVLAALALAAPAAAWGHARVSPAVSLAGVLQLYSLAVPTERAGATTSKVILTVPSGFGIDSFAPPPPGWRMTQQTTGSGGSAVVTRVTWSGGHTPTGEDSLFQFLAEPATPGAYTFHVEQTYSDGGVVNWTGSESSADPAPTIDAVKSFAGGGAAGSTVSIVALLVGIIGLLAAGLALTSRGRRPIA